MISKAMPQLFCQFRNESLTIKSKKKKNHCSALILKVFFLNLCQGNNFKFKFEKNRRYIFNSEKFPLHENGQIES